MWLDRKWMFYVQREKEIEYEQETEEADWKGIKLSLRFGRGSRQASFSKERLPKRLTVVKAQSSWNAIFSIELWFGRKVAAAEGGEGNLLPIKGRGPYLCLSSLFSLLEFLSNLSIYSFPIQKLFRRGCSRLWDWKSPSWTKDERLLPCRPKMKMIR